MKRVIALAAGSLALVAAPAAFAGGCNYGSHVSMASSEDAVEERVVEDEQDPKLLAMLRKQDEMESVETVVVPN